MNKFLGVLWAALVAVSLWSHQNPVLVGAIIMGGVGLLSRLAPSHPRLQGVIDILAAAGFDLDRLGKGLVKVATGTEPASKPADVTGLHSGKPNP